jgi:hypothetical protein
MLLRIACALLAVVTFVLLFVVVDELAGCAFLVVCLFLERIANAIERISPPSRRAFLEPPAPAEDWRLDVARRARERAGSA